MFISYYFTTLIFISFFFNDTATTEIYTLSLHDALPILGSCAIHLAPGVRGANPLSGAGRKSVERVQRSEEHTSELQSQFHLVCRLLLEKKKKKKSQNIVRYT